jgi:ribosomal protein L7/L12
MAQKPCPGCGAPVDVDERVCPYCGAAIAVSASDPTLLSGFSSGASDSLSEVREQIKRGKKIEAVRTYREITGASLKEARDAVQAIELGQPVAVPGQATLSTAAPAAFASSAEAMDEIKRLLRSGNKIEAIKVHREAFNTGLKDAKDAVDAIESDLRFQAAPRPSVTRSVGESASFAPAETVMSANPFDEPKQPPAWRNWAIGCTLALLLFCCLCVGLPALLYMFTGGQAGGF